VGQGHFENKARRSFWSLHVEAWRRSGVSRAAYCGDNRLNSGTFGRWLRALEVLELARIRARELRKRTREPISKDRHNKAVQAFWAMHVEALNWSGLTAKAYAEAHRISINSLRMWRARLDADPMQIDWRARVHPSVRLAVSTNASDSAKEPPAENILTAAPATDPPTSDHRHRRRFSEAEKLAIVLETEQPGTTVSQVARAHRIVTSVLFRWRAELGFGKSQPANLAAVRIANAQHGGAHDAGPEVVALQEMLPIPPGAIAIELADGRRVFAPAGSNPEAVRRYVAEREEKLRC
jgi:transposase-like protein